MPSISLHIGVPKTASSYIQAWLHRNRVRLGEHGIFVPERPIISHRLAVEHLKGSLWDKRPDLLEIRKTPLGEALNCFAEAMRSGGTTVAIISSEYFYYTDPTEVTRDLRKRLTSEVDVIVYIRSQGDLALSGHNQEVKRLAKTASRPRPQYQRMYDWGRLLDAWTKAVGKDRLKAISFDVSVRDRTILEDFVAAACPEIGQKFTDGEFENTTFFNESLPADLLEFKRISNELSDSGLYDYEWLEEALRSGYSGPRYGISAEEASDWRACYAASNEYVAKEYFSGASADAIFPEAANRAPGFDLEGNLPIESLAKLLAFAVRRHEKYRRATDERIRALERQLANLRGRPQPPR